MERWPRRTPTAQPSIVGLVLDALSDIPAQILADVLHALADALGEIPLVGDDIEAAVDNIAANINHAQSTANIAQSTANTANTNASTALGAANAANSAASAAATAASDAANVAAAANTLADKAYKNAQIQNKEFAVSQTGVVLGKNEERLGVLLTIPNNGLVLRGFITSVSYTLEQNNASSAVLQLIRRTVAGVESVIHTTTLAANETVREDNTIDFEFDHLDHVMCNVLSYTSGAVLSVLHCHLDYIYIEDEP